MCNLGIKGAISINYFIIWILSEYLEALRLIEVLVAVNRPVIGEEIKKKSVAFTLDDVVTYSVEVS